MQVGWADKTTKHTHPRGECYLPAFPRVPGVAKIVAAGRCEGKFLRMDGTRMNNYRGVLEANEAKFEANKGEGACLQPFNSTPMGVNSISSGSPHVRPMGVHCTCGEADEIKKHTQPETYSPPSRGQVLGSSTVLMASGSSSKRALRPPTYVTKSCSALERHCIGGARLELGSSLKRALPVPTYVTKPRTRATLRAWC